MKLSKKVLKASNGGWYSLIVAPDRDYQTGTYFTKEEAQAAGDKLSKRIETDKVCPNCGQWQSPDCLNECRKHGLA